MRFYMVLLPLLIFPASSIAAIPFPLPPSYLPDADATLVYDPSSGDLMLDYPPRGVGASEGGAYDSLELTSAAGLFRTEGRVLPGRLSAVHELFTVNKILSVGIFDPVTEFVIRGIMPVGLEGDFLRDDLTLSHGCPADACPSVVGLRVVPEPNAGFLAILGSLGIGCMRYRHNF